MSRIETYPTPLPIFGTLGLTFHIFARAWGKFIGLIIVWVAALVVAWLVAAGLAGSLPATFAHPVARGVGQFCQYAVQIVLHSAILFGAAEIVERGTFELRDALAVGGRRALPMAGVIILQILVTFPAFLLLVVPGIIVILMLYVATPACVIERRGPVDSLNRSIALTKGNRWRILGILGLVFLVLLTIGTLLVLIVVLLHTQKALMVGAVSLVGILVFIPLFVLATVLPAAVFCNLTAIQAQTATDPAPWGKSSPS